MTHKSLTGLQISLIAMVGLILLILGLTAFFSPPNTSDVQNYHMPRVMHWIQNQSVAHYPTGIEFQNSYPPGAEYQILHLAILAGSDRWVNFAAWFTLLAAALCVSLFAKTLQVALDGQILSALFLVTLPGALLQAGTSKNDLHVAFWVLLTLTFMLHYFYKRKAPLTLAAAFASLGIGISTKSNIIFFLIPILIWFAITFIRQNGIKESILWALVAVLIFTMINTGYMIRNMQTYGTPLETYQSGRHLSEWVTPRGLLTNLIRNTSFHLQIPWPEWRGEIQLFLLKVHVKLGMDINDPRTTSEGFFSILPMNTHENFSGNTLHALLLIPLSYFYFFQMRKKQPLIRYLFPLIFSISGFLLYSALVKWQIFGARYFLPVFFIAAPIFGAVMERIRLKIIPVGIAFIILILSWPWLLSAESRPIISNTRFTNGPSILSSDRIELLLGGTADGFPGLMQLPGVSAELGCDQIGIYGGGAATEYPIWAILNAPFSGYRLDWIVAGTPSAAYIDPSFEPCLIVCHDCPANQETIKNFTRFVDGNRFDLYRPVQNKID
jgi:4-amino-4-deoxy-L-arabinose transferase-like glycosyltransferase